MTTLFQNRNRSLPKHVEEFLEDLAESLQIPESRYEAAERSYKSIGEWLSRRESRLRLASPQVYIQGSFRLGTTIRPISDKEDYDLDLVCELTLPKASQTQQQLKQLLGSELHAYAQKHGMQAPEEGRRCWTQNYADGAQFHVDSLPAIPDGTGQRLLLEQRGYSAEWSASAIAITDKDHPHFRTISDDWPHSNPKGYSAWFRTRMARVFDQRRTALALELKENVEKIPDYKVRTALQNAIQILKRHRDMMFVSRSDEKPISIILTTLSAHAYGQEPSIAVALYSILDRMDQFIEDRGSVSWIPNPTDAAENFADRWQANPKRKAAFYEWLAQARADFTAAASSASRQLTTEVLSPRMGKVLVENANNRRGGHRSITGLLSLEGVKSFARKVLNPSHRQAPPWNASSQGQVRIERAVCTRSGFRPEEFSTDGSPLPKRCGLRFEADTTVPKPYRVFWQVVNTGVEAQAADGLRGGFDEGIVSVGNLTKDERTLFSGTHSIECFIVKNGLLAARSGQFIVNIQ